MVLPAPVGPTMATVWPGSAMSERSSMSGLLGVVGETHVVELDPATRVGVDERLGDVLRLFGEVEQLEHPLGGRDPGLQHVGHRRELRERLRELPGVLDERLHIAEAQVARCDSQAADHRDGDVVEVADEHHQRLDRARDELRTEARLEQLFVLGVERLLGVFAGGRRP